MTLAKPTMTRHIPGLALTAVAAYTIAWAWLIPAPTPPAPVPMRAILDLPAPPERTARTVLACWGKGYDTGRNRPGAASNTYKIGTKLLLGCDTPEGYQIYECVIGQWGPCRKEIELDLAEAGAVALRFKRAGVAPVDILEVENVSR